MELERSEKRDGEEILAEVAREETKRGEKVRNEKRSKEKRIIN